jgi:nucleotide sugar dehydrogenase
MGKIGLPLAVQFARKGHHVFGTDINEKTVHLINSKIEPFPGEENLKDLLSIEIDSGRLVATTDTMDAVSQSDAVVVVVPLFVDQDGVPNFKSMDSATEAIGKGLKNGTLISYETTLPIGTTRKRFAKALENYSKLKAGIDFYVCFSPERVFTGRVFADLRKYPKLVGGINAASTAKAIEFYNSVLDFDDRPDLTSTNGVWDLGNSEAAEFAKLAETTYRDVNIALANQFSIFAQNHGIDIYKVIEASNSQPYSHIHRPGIAVGGHCIPIYPQMYLWNDPKAELIKISRDLNSSMPSKVVDQLVEINGSLENVRVAILGASYRGGVKETAFSGVFSLVEALQFKGAIPLVHDPLYSDTELLDLGLTPYHYGSRAEVVIVQADHNEYSEIDETLFPGLKTLYDGRKITNPAKWKNVNHFIIGKGN